MLEVHEAHLEQCAFGGAHAMGQLVRQFSQGPLQIVVQGKPGRRCAIQEQKARLYAVGQFAGALLVRHPVLAARLAPQERLPMVSRV